MRFLRILVPILAIISIVAAIGTYLISLNENDAPIIKSVNGASEIEVTCDVTDEELLKFVTAHDEQDGDLTKEIVLQKNLYFTEQGKAGVTFAVCDSDNNVSKLGMTIVYTDYKSPKIEILGDLVVTRGRQVDFIKAFKVEDMLDGDITNRLKVISANYNPNVAGEYTANCKVTNSYGDTVEMDIELIVSDDLNYADVILNDYCVYVPKGTELDFASYIKEVLNDKDHRYDADDVEIDASEYDPSKEGVYNIYYRVKSGEDDAALCRMFVIVEDEEV